MNFPCILTYVCRSISHNVAINKLRNSGLYPVNTKPTSEYRSYNNFTSVLYSYWVYYCEAEGYNKHHAMARQVLLYVFYAKPHFKSMFLFLLLHMSLCMHYCMYPYVCLHVSLRMSACILTHFCIYPYVCLYISLRMIVYILTYVYIYPYAFCL